MLHKITHLNIGFVFSNSLNAIRITQYAIQENWLCFFNFAVRSTYHAGRTNWLCFFKFLSAIRITHHAIRTNWLCFFNLCFVRHGFTPINTVFFSYRYYRKMINRKSQFVNRKLHIPDVFIQPPLSLVNRQ